MMLVFVLGNYFDQWFICVLWRLMSPALTIPLVIYGHKRPLVLLLAPSLMREWESTLRASVASGA